MVSGIDIFRKHFSNFKDQYTVIGGFACDLLMTDAGLDFRQTVDIDMVLTVEALTTEFAKAFWAFIDQGGYQARQRSNEKPEFYRFVNPTDSAYPKMIELFSRPQNNVSLQPDAHLMPLHIDDEVSSLSAILLNNDYYHFLLDGRTVTDGRTILFADCGQLFASAQLFSESALPDSTPLTSSEVRELGQIWLEQISPDSELRNELRGWYRVQTRFVQNEYGNRFYPDTYGARWLAFDKED